MYSAINTHPTGRTLGVTTPISLCQLKGRRGAVPPNTHTLWTGKSHYNNPVPSGNTGGARAQMLTTTDGVNFCMLAGEFNEGTNAM